jgi:hypothetical protein
MDSTAVDEPKNVHYSVDPSGKTVMDLSFASEPLGLPALEGYGWPQFQAGESIGPEKRYLLSRKLGWGMSSSTWLSRDQKYVSSHCPRAPIELSSLQREQICGDQGVKRTLYQHDKERTCMGVGSADEDVGTAATIPSLLESPL